MTISVQAGGLPRTVVARRWLVAGVLLLVVIAGFFDRISIAVLFTTKVSWVRVSVGHCLAC
jgi:hypothetical protein